MSVHVPTHSVRLSRVCGAPTAGGSTCRLRTTVDHNCWIHGVKIKKVRVKPSQIPHAGMGLFAQVRVRPKRGQAPPVAFHKGELIDHYLGDDLTKAQLDVRYPPHGSGGTYVRRIHSNRYLDARETTSCHARFANRPSLPGHPSNSKLMNSHGNCNLRAIKNITVVKKSSPPTMLVVGHTWEVVVVEGVEE